MTNDSGATATSFSQLRGPGGAPSARQPAAAEAAPAGPDPAGRTHPHAESSDHPGDSGSSRGDERPSVAGAGVLAVLAVVYLAAMLWSAHAAITSQLLVQLAIASAAYALPGVVSASVVAGTAAALVVVSLLARRRSAGPGDDRMALRFAAGIGTGLAVGALAASTIVMTLGRGSATMIAAATIASGATLGGAFAGVRATRVVASAVAATLAVFAVGIVLNHFADPLLRLFGSSDTPGSNLSAAGWTAMTTSLSSGLAAGFVAVRYLRRAAAGSPGTAWSVDGPTPRSRLATVLRNGLPYLAAGAGAGVFLLLSEVITRTGGGRVLKLAGSISDSDRAGQAWLGQSRINNALFVLFVGAVVALIAYGRKLTPATAADEEYADGDDGWGEENAEWHGTGRAG